MFLVRLISNHTITWHPHLFFQSTEIIIHDFTKESFEMSGFLFLKLLIYVEILLTENYLGISQHCNYFRT